MLKNRKFQRELVGLDQRADPRQAPSPKVSEGVEIQIDLGVKLKLKILSTHSHLRQETRPARQAKIYSGRRKKELSKI